MKRSVKKLVVCGIIALMVCALCSLVAFAAADKSEPAPQDGTSVSQEAETNSAADSTGSYRSRYLRRYRSMRRRHRHGSYHCEVL